MAIVNWIRKKFHNMKCFLEKAKIYNFRYAIVMKLYFISGTKQVQAIETRVYHLLAKINNEKYACRCCGRWQDLLEAYLDFYDGHIYRECCEEWEKEPDAYVIDFSYEEE